MEEVVRSPFKDSDFDHETQGKGHLTPKVIHQQEIFGKHTI